MTHTDGSPLFCDRCLRELVPGSGDFFVVTIEAIADPTPMIVVDEPFSKNYRREIEELLDQMQDLSAREAMDQVHRRLTLHLCTACYHNWIENPTSS